MPQAVEVRPTIDRRWLEHVAALEPLTHAYALWDLDRTPGQVRFTSAVRGDETVGYLLIWLGRRDRPVVHWFGGMDLVPTLLPAFPSPPLLAVVPPEIDVAVASRFPGASRTRLKMMVREPGWLEARTGVVRRLRREDSPQLSMLIRNQGEAELGVYAGLDPATEPAWGVFEGDRLVGVARAAVRLPRIWVLGGIFVEPARRGRGLGAALVAAATREAERVGARAGLYVREEPATALHLYERLGFREVGRRSWFDVPASAPA